MKRTYMFPFILSLLVLLITNCGGGGDSNSKPVAEITFSSNGLDEGEVFSFAGSYSDINTTDTHELAWDFGDGSPAVLDTLTPSHIFTDNGDFTVTFAVRDSAGGVGTDSFVVKAFNVPPVALAGTDLFGYEGSNITFTGDFTDAGAADTIDLYEWDFEYDGVTFSPMDTGQSVQHSWPDQGVHTAALRVWDDDGDPSPIDTLVVTVENADPVVSAGDNQTIGEGSQFAGSGSFVDAGVNDSWTGTVNYGDGSGDQALTLNLDQSFALTHTYDAEEGEYTVTVTISDGDGGSHADTLIVTVENVAPTVDAWSGNDEVIDYAGAEGHIFSFAGSFTDPGINDNHTLEWDLGDGTIVSGTPPDDLTQSHIYTDNGPFTVLLTVDDGEGGMGTDSFVVTVYNVPPVALAGTDLSGYEGSNITFTGSFTDAGAADTIDLYEWDFEYDGVTFSPMDTGQSVQHSWTDQGVHTAALRVWDDDGDPSPIDTLVVTVENADPVVSVSSNDQTIDEGDQFAGSGSFIDAGVNDSWSATVNYGDGGGDQTLPLNPDQSFALAHTYTDDGEYTVKVTISDGDGGSNADSLIVTVNNLPPEVFLSGDQTIDEGDQFAGSGSFIDAGVNDSWSATVNYGDGGGDQTLPLNPDQSFALAHTYTDDGEYTVAVTVSDGDGGSNADSLIVTVNALSTEAPTNLAETLITSSSVAMAWSDNATNEDGYSVLRSSSMGGPFTTLADLGPDSESYTNSGLQPGTNYYYQVAAWNTFDTSYSSVLGVTTDLITLNPVAAYYDANGVNWNDYVINNGVAVGDIPAKFLASDTAAPPTGTGGYSSVLHGGEMRAVTVTGISDCTGITAYDTLGAFEWTCLPGDPVTVVSTGLADGVYLSDLIDFGTSPYWWENSVTVNVNNDEKGYGITPASYWWDNPVHALPGSGTLSEEGAVYAMVYTTISVVPADIVIGEDKVSIVTQPGAITLQGAEKSNVVQAAGHSFLWIEADMMGASVGSGSSSILSLTDVEFSVLRGVSTSGASFGVLPSGVSLDTSSNNLLKDVTARDNASLISSEGLGIHLYYSDGNELDNCSVSDNQMHGIYMFRSDSNRLTGVKAYGNGGCGVRIRESESNRLYSSRMADNGEGGLELNDTTDTIVSGITAYNNVAQGIYVLNGSDNVLMNVTSFNNVRGIALDLTSNNALIDLTVNNNLYGVVLGGYFGTDPVGSDYNTVAGMVSANNTYSGLELENSDYNTFSNIVSADHGLYAVYSYSSSDNRFTGTLKVGNECMVLGTYTAAGIANTTCAITAPSDADYFATGISLAGSFVGKATSDINPDGIATEYEDITDWMTFNNVFRGWGLDGLAFPSDTHRGYTTVPDDDMHIWDWSLDSGDTDLLDALAGYSEADTLIHIWSDGTAEFLRHAVEIVDDDVGNNDGLCEAGEDCIYTPNIGSYQGHDDLVGPTTVGDIDLYEYETNGR